ncbi:MAG: hypothetical protein AAF685_09265 [Cyanobacteria bacterium P01_C01_bin.89]
MVANLSDPPLLQTIDRNNNTLINPTPNTMTTKELILQKLDLVPEPVLRAILKLLDAYPTPRRQWSPHFFERTAGAWQGEKLVRAPQETQPERPLFD